MNYIKPEDIKEYVSKNPEGIAGISQELAAMVNHFAELIVLECARAADEGMAQVTMRVEWPSYHIKKHFGVE